MHACICAATSITFLALFRSDLNENTLSSRKAPYLWNIILWCCCWTVLLTNDLYIIQFHISLPLVPAQRKCRWHVCVCCGSFIKFVVVLWPEHFLNIFCNPAVPRCNKHLWWWSTSATLTHLQTKYLIIFVYFVNYCMEIMSCCCTFNF